MSFRFHKMHGLGNDFVVIDARDAPFAIDAARARSIADRREALPQASTSLPSAFHIRIFADAVLEGSIRIS